MTVKLSKRLAEIAGRLSGSGFDLLADIGSDHALLPIHAVKHGLCRRAVAADIHDGPLLAAKRNIAGAGLSDRIDIRKGDGLAVLSPGEADAVVIAGMGGSTITGILEAGKDRLAGVRLLLLQPNVGAPLVRRWLHDHGWFLRDECILEEDGLYYDILEAVPAQPGDGRQAKLYEPYRLEGGKVVDSGMQMLLGPHLVRRPSRIFIDRWLGEIAKRERITGRMKNAQSPEAAEKRRIMERETEEIREVLACLPMDKPSSG
jgi:tRNA (adenine22-N1)-methyltransferase